MKVDIDVPSEAFAEDLLWHAETTDIPELKDPLLRDV